ncbi:hypothetical protein [Gracilibacillus alcaliphilus]|uniref:hypothetical protein n=1 Tax=Gracilibacillus alcaliphilus TaxID=1401441 RepID=UPI00195742B4|nr:hypothetical protein [Gracilibacillus alcaliphilus]MBM7675870.1 hypothetical protein [Gracilibacillus alcaliphilus]
MMEFLYFPEDKSLYIPSVISLIIFAAGAVLTMYLIKKAAKKEQREFEQKYQDIHDK